MCLYCDSRKWMQVKVMNTGALLQERWLILRGEFINFMIELFYSAHEIRRD